MIYSRKKADTEMYSVKAAYNLYEKSCKKELEITKGFKPVSYATYDKIIRLFSRFVLAKVFQNLNIRLPNNFGYMSLKMKKTAIKEKNGMMVGPVDWVATKKMWEENPTLKEKKQLVFHLNAHSSGQLYQIAWDSKFAHHITDIKHFYSFAATKSAKRILSDLLKQNKLSNYEELIAPIYSYKRIVK